jgi:hypothetical protein
MKLVSGVITVFSVTNGLRIVKEIFAHDGAGTTKGTTTEVDSMGVGRT